MPISLTLYFSFNSALCEAKTALASLLFAFFGRDTVRVCCLLKIEK